MVILPDNGRDPELTAVLKRAQAEAQDEYYAKKRRQAQKAKPDKRKPQKGGGLSSAAIGV